MKKKITLLLLIIPTAAFTGKISLQKTNKFEKRTLKSDTAKFLLLDNRIIE